MSTNPIVLSILRGSPSDELNSMASHYITSYVLVNSRLVVSKILCLRNGLSFSTGRSPVKIGEDNRKSNETNPSRQISISPEKTMLDALTRTPCWGKCKNKISSLLLKYAPIAKQYTYAHTTQIFPGWDISAFKQWPLDITPSTFKQIIGLSNWYFFIVMDIISWKINLYRSIIGTIFLQTW